MPQFLQIDKVRALIADYLNIDIKRVTDEAHFTEDLRADRLDRLELMILVEEQFTGLGITGDIANHIEVVGDLIATLKRGWGDVMLTYLELQAMIIRLRFVKPKWECSRFAEESATV
jgi:acyl carrier protein